MSKRNQYFSVYAKNNWLFYKTILVTCRIRGTRRHLLITSIFLFYIKSILKVIIFVLNFFLRDVFL